MILICAFRGFGGIYFYVTIVPKGSSSKWKIRSSFLTKLTTWYVQEYVYIYISLSVCVFLYSALRLS